jgi:hypothetical protein
MMNGESFGTLFGRRQGGSDARAKKKETTRKPGNELPYFIRTVVDRSDRDGLVKKFPSVRFGGFHF